MKLKAYLLTVLHRGDDFSYSQCMLDFDDLLEESFEKGYILSNRTYLFFSEETYDEIQMKLDSFKEKKLNYSYVFVEISQLILEDKFSLEIERIDSSQRLSKQLRESINEFKASNKLEMSVINADLSHQEQIDLILEKVSLHGEKSLTKTEIEILKKI